MTPKLIIFQPQKHEFIQMQRCSDIVKNGFQRVDTKKFNMQLSRRIFEGCLQLDQSATLSLSVINRLSYRLKLKLEVKNIDFALLLWFLFANRTRCFSFVKQAGISRVIYEILFWAGKFLRHIEWSAHKKDKSKELLRNVFRLERVLLSKTLKTLPVNSSLKQLAIDQSFIRGQCK